MSTITSAPVGSNANSIAIDKSKFNKTLPLVALKIPAKLCNVYLDVCKDICFNRPKVRRIYTIENDPAHRLLLLSESIKSEEDFPVELKDLNSTHGAVSEAYNFQITYDQLGVEESLRQLLPADIAEIPCSFEQAGHLAHLNLREETLPYKHIIGQVILDKNPAISTVVNKIGNIETEFRTFPMELLAGENNYNVSVKESGATFKFNFADVYWNSRLQMEHARIINWISGLSSTTPSSMNSNLTLKATVNANKSSSHKESSNSTTTVGSRKKVVVADMMAGVGPFAVPLAMGNIGDFDITVHANDLNPSSYKHLLVNARFNHCGSRLVPYNLDGRDFILDLLDDNIQFQEVIMNLPQNATDFLDVFIGLGKRLGEKKFAEWKELPRIHVYAFSTCMDDPVGDIVNRSAGVLQCDPALLKYTKGSADGSTSSGVVDRDAALGHVVRDVSPKKVMVCLSFILPREVALSDPVVVSRRNGKRSADTEAESDASKAAKL